MKTFVSVFAALIAAGTIFACVFWGWQKLESWEHDKREAMAFINQTYSASHEILAEADHSSIESLESALSMSGRLSSKRREACDALIIILEHKPFLPLNEEETKTLNDLKSAKTK